MIFSSFLAKIDPLLLYIPLSFLIFLSRVLLDLEEIKVPQDYPETMGSLVWMDKEDLKVHQVPVEKMGYLDCPEELEARVCWKSFQ